jgi:hypothetical protein
MRQIKVIKVNAASHWGRERRANREIAKWEAKGYTLQSAEDAKYGTSVMTLIFRRTR